MGSFPTIHASDALEKSDKRSTTFEISVVRARSGEWFYAVVCGQSFTLSNGNETRLSHPSFTVSGLYEAGIAAMESVRVELYEAGE